MISQGFLGNLGWIWCTPQVMCSPSAHAVVARDEARVVLLRLPSWNTLPPLKTLSNKFKTLGVI